MKNTEYGLAIGTLLSAFLMNLLTLILVTGAGCKTVPTDVELARWQGVAREAAFAGTLKRLSTKPEDRATFQSARDGLQLLAASPTIEPGNIAAILDTLGIKELSGTQGAVNWQHALNIYTIATGRTFEVATPELAKVVASGLADGINQALAYTPQTPQ